MYKQNNMTLTEYINQENPKRQPVGSVEVKEEECFSIIDLGHCKNVVLKINGKYYAYYLETKKGFMGLDPSPILWSMDEDGNKDRRSVFAIKQ